jgi:hypothetical protein
MRGARRRGWLLLPLLVACGKSTGQQASPSASGHPPVAHASSLAASPPAPSEAAPAAHPEPTCRALRVSGEAEQGGAPLASGAQLDGAEWVTLGAGASLTLKHTLSGREIAIAGPASFRACRRGREQVLLARGKVQSGSGMGSRPGAEVLIATPVAAVRYADADFTLALDDKKLSVAVRAGQVELDAASDAHSKGWKSPLRAKDELSVPLGKPDATQLMARCQAAAEAAESTARRVGDHNATESLGERAQAHVRARKTARAACTIAASATGLVADSSARAGLWADAVRWEGLWETIPRPRPVQPAEK